MSTCRSCLREPIPELFDAGRFLNAAVSCHLSGHADLAEKLFRVADLPAINDWAESLWGKGGPWSKPLHVDEALPSVPKLDRLHARMPITADKSALIKRDGLHCRFCGIPVVRPEIRTLIRKTYPTAVRWGPRNADKHAAFQALELTYDHLTPHSRGGRSSMENMVVACQPCNCGRSERTLAEVGLADPRLRAPKVSDWDGLERFKIKALPGV